MLKGLRGRGPDSTGLGLYAPDDDGSSWCASGATSRRRPPTARAPSARSTAWGVADVTTTSGDPALPRARRRAGGDVCDVVEGGDRDVEVFSVGHSLQIYKHLTDGEELAQHYRLRGVAGPPRRRAHAAGHGVARRRAARPPVLGAAVRRHLRRAQRAHHELPQAAPALRAARPPLLHGQRLRAAGAVPGRAPGGGAIDRRGHGGLDPRPRRRVLLPAARPRDGLGVARDRIGSMPARDRRDRRLGRRGERGHRGAQAPSGPRSPSRPTFRELGVGRVATWTL